MGIIKSGSSPNYLMDYEDSRGQGFKDSSEMLKLKGFQGSRIQVVKFRSLEPLTPGILESLLATFWEKNLKG